MTVVQATNITVTADDRVLLDNVSVQIAPGQLVAIVGPNGAGKSTLLSVLAGDWPTNAGNVYFDGENITVMRARDLARKRAVLPQQTYIQFSFTCQEIVEMGRSANVNSHNDVNAVRAALETVDALHLQYRIFKTLSVGEQARVSLARVLAQETPVLLLDEPTAALDLRHQQLVMQVARKLASTGVATAVVLHDLNLAAAYADRIVLLQDGRLVADGSPWDTLTETMLEAVFDCPVMVTSHPQIGCPLVVPQCPIYPLHHNQSLTGSDVAPNLHSG